MNDDAMVKMRKKRIMEMAMPMETVIGIEVVVWVVLFQQTRFKYFGWMKLS
jgi:hypothetical protein